MTEGKAARDVLLSKTAACLLKLWLTYICHHFFAWWITVRPIDWGS